MYVVIGIASTAIGILAFVSLAVPKYRFAWQGRSTPAGRTTHLGFGLIFFNTGVLFIIHHDNRPAPALLSIGIVLGFVLAAVGNCIDP